MNLIHELQGQWRHNDNCIKNEFITIRYSQLGNYFEELDGLVDLRDIPSNACFRLYFQNSPVDVLVLMYLLSKNVNVFISGKEESPTFCSHSIAIDQKRLKESDWSLNDVVQLSELNIKDYPLKQNQCVIVETSGSTGSSKFVLFSKTNFLYNSKHVLSRINILNQDNVFISVPCYHMYGLGAALLPSLIAGASIHMLGNYNIIKYTEYSRAFEPTIVFQAPSMINMLTELSGAAQKYKLSIVAGDKTDKSRWVAYEEKFGMLINLYGSTELGVIATSIVTDEPALKHDGYLSFLDTVEPQWKPLDEDKFLLEIKHPYSFDTYMDSLGMPIQIESKSPSKDGWFPSNDVCARKGSNRFLLLDRYDNTVNRNGKLISFNEIERKVEHGIEAVQKSIVIAGDRNSIRGRELVLFYQMKDGENVDLDVRKACFKLMNRDYVPDVAICLTEFPKLPNGKINRMKLKEELSSR
ncbi:MAG: AMP-binding protein [Cytophagales bacterium]|nr:AMP-binding protein [Cytophagales bacterium]